MNPVLKFVAALLVLVAVALGVVAYRIASKPPPPAPAPVAVQQAAPTEKPIVTYPVVVAAQSIAAGVAMTADDFKVVQWPVSPARGFASTEGLAGKYLRFDVAMGEPLTQGMLMRGLATYLKEGERAVSIPIDEVSGAANRVLPGDKVDVFFTMNRESGSGAEKEISDTQSRLLLPQVRVLAYGINSLDGPPPSAGKDDANNRGSSRDAKASNAMLAIPLESVNELLLATRSGKLQLALRSPKDEALPDIALFPKRAPLLQGRKDLTSEQRAQLAQAENRAYAGDSLTEVSGSEATAEKNPAPRPRGAPARPRAIEVIRGGKSQMVPY
jgi:pilus assembly protein CpaB